jgi:hypothetical protein
MPEPLSDEKVARQILAVFAAHHMASGGTLRRNHFLTVRDGDFQRGLNKAVEKRWISIAKRDRYTYELTNVGATEIAESRTLPSAT